MAKHDVIKCDSGWLPVWFGFCPSEKAWNKFVKGIGLKGEPYPRQTGGCVSRLNTPLGSYLLVSVNEENAKSWRAPWGVADFIVHEAVHVWQQICNIIGEDKPSKEFEAYSIQRIAFELAKARKKARR